MKRMFFYCLTAISLLLVFPSASQSSALVEIYNVQNIKIEAVANDDNTAKLQAIESGKKIAFSELMNRFLSYGYLDKTANVPPATISDTISKVDIIEELVEKGSYEARVNYIFEPRKVLDLLQVERNGTMPKKERYLLVPTLIDGDKVKPWNSVWVEAWKMHGDAPLVVPSADLEDMQTVNAQDLSGFQYAGLDKLARRYKTPVVIIAEANYDIPKNTLYVRLKRFEEVGQLVAEYKYHGVFGLGSRELFSTAAEDIMSDIKKNGTKTDGEILKDRDLEYERNFGSERSADAKDLQVEVNSRSLSDWSAIRRKLVNSKLINDVAVSAFTHDKAYIKMRYIGEIDELQRSLAVNGLTLTEVDGSYIIDRF